MQEVQTGTEVANTEKGYSPGVFTVKEDKKDSFQSILERYERRDDVSYDNTDYLHPCGIQISEPSC